MYFPYLRGRQFELLALRELLENDCISDKIIPIIEPVKPSSTLVKTLQTFIDANREIAVILNPKVGDFRDELIEMYKEGSKTAEKLTGFFNANDLIIKSYIMDDATLSKIKALDDKEQFLIINPDRDCLSAFLTAYEDALPRFTLMPEDRAFKRIVTDGKIVLEDHFRKKPRNIDYLENEDEFFSEEHLFFEKENLTGFADYTIVGKDFNETGFAPVAVAIHIVYFDAEKNLKVHHFVSDSNDGIEDPGGKFGEALEKLVEWCRNQNIETTLGLQGFYDCYETGKYPGLGTVKKLSIMHHLELMSRFLGGR